MSRAPRKRGLLSTHLGDEASVNGQAVPELPVHFEHGVLRLDVDGKIGCGEKAVVTAVLATEVCAAAVRKVKMPATRREGRS